MASQNPDFQLSLLIGKIRTPNNSQSTKINIILPCVNTSITTATTKRYLWTLLTSTCLSLSLQDEKLHEKSLEIWKMRKREEVPRYSGLNRRKEQTGKSRWLYTTLRYVLHQLKKGEEDEFRSVFRGLWAYSKCISILEVCQLCYCAYVILIFHGTRSAGKTRN